MYLTVKLYSGSTKFLHGLLFYEDDDEAIESFFSFELASCSGRTRERRWRATPTAKEVISEASTSFLHIHSEHWVHLPVAFCEGLVHAIWESRILFSREESFNAESLTPLSPPNRVLPRNIRVCFLAPWVVDGNCPKYAVFYFLNGMHSEKLHPLIRLLVVGILEESRKSSCSASQSVSVSNKWDEPPGEWLVSPTPKEIVSACAKNPP